MLELIGLFCLMLVGIIIISYCFIYIMQWSDDRTNRHSKIDLD